MRTTRRIQVGSVAVGGGAPVSIQSMTNTDTGDTEATLAQIRELAEAGCDIVRSTVPARNVLPAFERICRESPLPVVADIHFDHTLALAALERGAACVRVNPGNLRGGEEAAREVARKAAEFGRSVRIGVNGGSLAPQVVERLGRTPEALVASAEHYVRLFESAGCRELKVSLKASDVRVTVEACRRFARESDIPLHIGVTEAGPVSCGIIKSAVGIGSLLLDGIGETLRVSLTAPPIEEVRTALKILAAVGLRPAEPELVSCPTCGRTRVGLMELVSQVEREIERIKASGRRIALRKVAVMGCVVNGPGEAADADVGIAGSNHGGILFKHGVKVATLDKAELLPAIVRELEAASIPRRA